MDTTGSSKPIIIIYQTIHFDIPEDLIIGYISLSLDSKMELDLSRVNAGIQLHLPTYETSFPSLMLLLTLRLADSFGYMTVNITMSLGAALHFSYA
jgi:predicted proteasome-type protease